MEPGTEWHSLQPLPVLEWHFLQLLLVLVLRKGLWSAALLLPSLHDAFPVGR